VGTRNWQLVRDLEIARKAKRADEVKRLEVQLEESQQACPHPKEQVHITKAAVDEVTTYRGLIKRGDQVMRCLACSRYLRHYQ